MAGVMKDEQFSWSEDELEGRYQIVLSVDIGNRNMLNTITAALTAAARNTPGVLGYKTDVLYVIAGHNRKPVSS
jgi:hypothetical protein